MNAPRVKGYSALIDANAIVKWKVPAGVTSQVLAFEGGEGGYRVCGSKEQQMGASGDVSRN